MKTMIRSTVVMVLLSAFALQVFGQEPAMPEEAKRLAATVRLPKYFASIVNDLQRREIAEIQMSYRERVQALEGQLAALKAEELVEVERVLSQGQREQLEEMRAKAMQRAKAMPRSKSNSTPAPPAAAMPPAAKSAGDSAADSVADNALDATTATKAKSKARSKASAPGELKVD
jgi:hypothetical protein